MDPALRRQLEAGAAELLVSLSTQGTKPCGSVRIRPHACETLPRLYAMNLVVLRLGVQGAVGSNPATPIQSETGFPSRFRCFWVWGIYTATYDGGVFVGQVVRMLPKKDGGLYPQVIQR